MASIKEVPPIPRGMRKSEILISEHIYTPENMPGHRFRYLYEIYRHLGGQSKIQIGKFFIRYYMT